MPTPRRLVEACAGAFLPHRRRGIIHAQQDADLGLLAFDHTTEIAQLRHRDVSRLDRQDDLFRLCNVAIVEEDTPIDSLVGTLLPIDGPGPDQSKCPPLELVRVVVCQLSRVRQGDRLTDDFVLSGAAENVIEAIADQADGERRNVDSDPPTVELLGCRDRGPAAAEWIEHYVAFVAAGGNDSFQ